MELSHIAQFILCPRRTLRSMDSEEILSEELLQRFKKAFGRDMTTEERSCCFLQPSPEKWEDEDND
jgi:hypothetical protein